MQIRPNRPVSRLRRVTHLSGRPAELLPELTRGLHHGLQSNEEVAMNQFIENNRIPAGFIAEAADMAPMAVLLCSPLSRFIVGQSIVIDGGQHHSLF